MRKKRLFVRSFVALCMMLGIAAPCVLAGDKMTLDCGNGVAMELVRIPAGTFMMGSPKTEEGNSKDEDQFQVTISKPFYIGAYEVTQAQYQEVMGGRNRNEFKGDNLPAENLSWNHAVEFCKKLSEKTGRVVRLPTEAEWEYACRAGTTTPFSFGDTISTDLVNYDGNFVYGNGQKGEDRAKTMPVGSFPPNAWGLYEMHGNVLEWCSDWFGEYDRENNVDPKGVELSRIRVCRGGSWRDYPGHCRSARRHWFEPGYRYGFLGFRVVVEE